MFSIDKFSVAMLFFGAGLGGLIQVIPAPLDFLNPYLTIVFFLVSVVFLIMR
ncbi:MAG: hypothetical protein NUV67_05170 [archaeon]|nr:hypothetical protein [archaeon]